MAFFRAHGVIRVLRLMYVVTWVNPLKMTVLSIALEYQRKIEVIFKNKLITYVTFMFIPCILYNKCLLYTNICTNKYCKFILKLLRHV